MTDNYFDGEWRPVTRTDDATLYLLRRRGFVFGSDEAGRLMARWPIAPAALRKTIIAGSRTITDMAIVERAIQQSGFGIDEVVSGGARGIDTLAQQWAAYYNIPVKVFMAKWDIHGKSAGAIRNQEMAEYGEQLIAIWDGISAGTRHMIECAERKGIPSYVFHYLSAGVTIRHSHGRYYATDGRRFGGWAETEAGALDQWHKL